MNKQYEVRIWTGHLYVTVAVVESGWQAYAIARTYEPYCRVEVVYR